MIYILQCSPRGHISAWAADDTQDLRQKIEGDGSRGQFHIIRQLLAWDGHASIAEAEADDERDEGLLALAKVHGLDSTVYKWGSGDWQVGDEAAYIADGLDDDQRWAEMWETAADARASLNDQAWRAWAGATACVKLKCLLDCHE